MRTTLTLDEDVASRLKKLMRAKGLSLKAAINQVLRRGLSATAEETPPAPFVVQAHSCGAFSPGVDPWKLGQLADELEVAAVLPHRR